jgi:hypothetical protein
MSTETLRVADWIELGDGALPMPARGTALCFIGRPGRPADASGGSCHRRSDALASDVQPGSAGEAASRERLGRCGEGPRCGLAEGTCPRETL